MVADIRFEALLFLSFHLVHCNGYATMYSSCVPIMKGHGRPIEKWPRSKRDIGVSAGNGFLMTIFLSNCVKVLQEECSRVHCVDGKFHQQAPRSRLYSQR